MKRIILVGVMLILFAACGSQEVRVECKNQMMVEYGEDLRESDVIDAEQTEEGVSIKEVEQFDQWRIGEQTVSITFVNQKEHLKKIMVSIFVQDSKPPEIVLEQEVLELTAGEEIDLVKNILSVKDPVDGDLELTEQIEGRGGYRINSGNFDSCIAGSYDIMVYAYDRNGNAVERGFVVKVIARMEEKKEIETKYPTLSSDHEAPMGGQTIDDIASKRIDSPTNSDTLIEKDPIPESELKTQPEKCSMEYKEGQLGNSNRAFFSMQEANDWAKKQVLEEGNVWWMKGWYVGQTYNECTRKSMFTVDFY